MYPPPVLDPIERLRYFLATAPTDWRPGDLVKRFALGNGESISCVLWKGLFYVTGTDIVKSLLFRFQMMNRPIINTKKFEEGVFSDLRNLKPGLDASLEEPRSEFLDVLYRNGCIRTQKKQKVFYWYSVPHERLFSDALDRDLRRESNLIHVNAFLGRQQSMNPSAMYSAMFAQMAANMPTPLSIQQPQGTPHLPMALGHHHMVSYIMASTSQMEGNNNINGQPIATHHHIDGDDDCKSVTTVDPSMVFEKGNDHHMMDHLDDKDPYFMSLAPHSMDGLIPGVSSNAASAIRLPEGVVRRPSRFETFI